jgi:hypothetical protein
MNGNDIAIRQNEPKMLHLLAAQRQLYSEEKHYKAILYASITTISLGIMALMEFGLLPFTDQQITCVIFFLTIIEFSVPEFFESKRIVAASVQELIDCELLQLKWNDILVDRPESQLIKGAIDRFNKKPNSKEAYDEIRNWYSVDFTIDTPLKQARLICQKSNLRWETDVRNEWRMFLHIGLGVGVCLAIVLGVFVQKSIIDYFAGPFLLLSMLAIIAFKALLDQGSVHKRLERLDRKAECMLQEISHADVDEATILEKSRQLQDGIYNHRIRNSTVPDYIYRRVYGRKEPSSAKPDVVAERY